MEIIYFALFNLVFTLICLVWLFNYFFGLFNAQADLIDRILKNSNIRFANIVEEDETIESMDDDSQRTHILGGVVDHGTHTTGVCHPDCWCNVSKEEEE